MQSPARIAVDATGNVYITDSYNQRVRRVNPAGTITPYAGKCFPDDLGVLGTSHLIDPQALVLAPGLAFIASGGGGVVMAARTATMQLEVVAGRYASTTPTPGKARFQGSSFGSVGGVAYDESAHVLYLTESTFDLIHAVTIVDPADANTWTIAELAGGTAGYVDGALAVARFRKPTGLFFDASTKQLYVADTGNHAIRAIDLATGTASATVRTVAGTPQTRGFGGDGAAATAALLYEPHAVTRCSNGDLFIADTGNHRVRRVSTAGIISTVLGDGVPGSSGEGAPSAIFPVHAPDGLACDAAGDVFVTSTETVRALPASAQGIVDGTGVVKTIYGAPPRTSFPQSVTSCLSGIAVRDASTVQVTDACSGLLLELRRETGP
jgi:DNA-binding beta-propeller fold protein YncE